MQLEHLNLVVNDIDTMIEFYQAAMPHWQVRGSGRSDWYGKQRTWLHFGDDYQYLTFNDNGVEENRDLRGHQVGVAHFAFVTTDLQGIDQRLKDAGFTQRKDGAEDPYRSNVYYIDPAGFEVEFVEYHSDQPGERNQYTA
jgi:catechol 2,3-dioxygenase-like lactoylglutathione lyase family enzyme